MKIKYIQKLDYNIFATTNWLSENVNVFNTFK